MAVRSRSLANLDTVANNTWVVAYTVPIGRTAIVRTFVLGNTSGAVKIASVRVRSTSASALVARYPNVEAGTTVGQYDCNVVLNPGDVVEVRFDGAGTTSQTFYAAGSLLEGEPQ